MKREGQTGGEKERGRKSETGLVISGMGAWVVGEWWGEMRRPIPEWGWVRVARGRGGKEKWQQND